MWTCLKCGRIFKKKNQPHSCKKVSIKIHFEDKKKAKEIFDCLVDKTNKKVGKVKIISIPCCVHLFGTYDFLAALPKKDGLEIRFALDRVLDSSRLKTSVPLSQKSYKNCIDIRKVEEIDNEILGWVKESYYLKG